MHCTPFFLKMTIRSTCPLGLQIVCITSCKGSRGQINLNIIVVYQAGGELEKTRKREHKEGHTNKREKIHLGAGQHREPLAGNLSMETARFRRAM